MFADILVGRFNNGQLLVRLLLVDLLILLLCTETGSLMKKLDMT
jgi:hypothetical protein